mgnify:CR=1 FL=1
MERIISFGFGENFIDRLSTFIVDNFPTKNNDFSNILCVFGGKRPALFLKHQLANKIKSVFFPPTIFSMDEFVEYIVSKKFLIKKIKDLDAYYLIYSIVKEKESQILKGKKEFNEFLPWAKEIVSFIEQLELEDISDKSLRRVEKSADIGYDIPHSVNVLLQNISSLRKDYYQALKNKGLFTRGRLYLYAAKIVEDIDFREFKEIIFCNFFYLHTTEKNIIKKIYRKNKGILIFQGNESEWSVLKSNAQNLGVTLLNASGSIQNKPQISILSGVDLHSQIGLVQEVLNNLNNLNNTVIVLPQPEAVIPLVSAISSFTRNFNISLGYPLKRTPIFELFNIFLKAQETKKNGKYYSPHYIRILRNPLVKNLKLASKREITRVIVHKLEEILKGIIPNELGGSLFIKLADIENSHELYVSVRDTLRNMKISSALKELKEIVLKLHQLFFYSFERVNNFKYFCEITEKIVNILLEKSMIGSFPFNRLALDKVFAINEEVVSSIFCEHKFSPLEIFSIFLKKLEDEVISFKGSPLKGLQVLGLMETRSLDFDNVIVINVNEASLPKLKVCEPLIPREVMLTLGINRLEKEEEIQRYQFLRLISNSKKAFLIYEENSNKERSRFIEEIIWKRQKELNRLDIFDIPRATFALRIRRYRTLSFKNRKIIDFLRKTVYSASRLNTYLRCPLQFYYQYVLNLDKKSAPLEEPQGEEIGKFIHQFLEEVFHCFIGKNPIINKEFENKFIQHFENKFSILSRRMKADSFLLKKIIKNRLKKFLEEEKKSPHKEILCLEKEFSGTINIEGEYFNFVAKVDRIDKYSENITIVDYKTGSSDVIPKDIYHLKKMKFNRENIRRNIKSFQLPLYYIIIRKYFPNSNIDAQIYNLRTMEKKSLFPQDYGNAREYLRIYYKAIKSIIREILDPSIPFTPDREDRKCHMCSFIYLCRG